MMVAATYRATIEVGANAHLLSQTHKLLDCVSIRYYLVYYCILLKSSSTSSGQGLTFAEDSL